jgi:hypothetical protein
MANRIQKRPARSRKKISRASSSHIQSAKKSSLRKPKLQFEWAEAISPDQWETYRAAIHALRDAGIDFLLGGGFALAIYTGRWRNTKDIDFYIFQKDRDRAVAALAKAGFHDYFDQLPYDRKWIYRSTRDGMIVDIIWSMANQRAQVDNLWFENSTPLSMRGEPLRVVPMEEFAWCKLYILQRDHCDWTDVMNLLYAAGTKLDWTRLLVRLENDWPLLKGLLSVYGWLCPKQAAALPETLYKKLRLNPPAASKHPKQERIRLLDSRGWFAALLPKNKPLEI